MRERGTCCSLPNGSLAAISRATKTAPRLAATRVAAFTSASDAANVETEKPSCSLRECVSTWERDPQYADALAPVAGLV